MRRPPTRPGGSGPTRRAIATALAAAALLLAAAWWRLPAGRRLRAGALVAVTAAWVGEGSLSGPGFTLPVTVRWQRPGWWRVQSPAGDAAFDGRTLTSRLPGGPVRALATGVSAQATWRILWPAPALRRGGPIDFDRRGWPVGWRQQGLTLRYTGVAPVPRLPRADFSLGAAAAPGGPVAAPPSLTPHRLPFVPRPAPGLRPTWTAAYDLPGPGPVAVFAYTLGAGPLTIAEQPGACPLTDPTWVRTVDGWIVHWCARALQFTADGPDDRAAITAVVRSLG